MGEMDPGLRDKVTAQLIATHLMQHVQGHDLHQSEFAHTMIERAFSILMEMISLTEPHDVYLALVCFMQELEVNDFPLFETRADSSPSILTFSMKREFVPMASSACTKALAKRSIDLTEGDIKSVMRGACLSLKGEPEHPHAVMKKLLCSVSLKD